MGKWAFSPITEAKKKGAGKTDCSTHCLHVAQTLRANLENDSGWSSPQNPLLAPIFSQRKNWVLRTTVCKSVALLHQIGGPVTSLLWPLYPPVLCFRHMGFQAIPQCPWHGPPRDLNFNHFLCHDSSPKHLCGQISHFFQSFCAVLFYQF